MKDIRNIGVIVTSLGNTQLSYSIVKNINEFYRNNPNSNISFSVFYESLQQPCVEPNFAVYRLSEAFEFPGDLIATSLSTASKLSNIPIEGNRFFLSWDIEWYRKILAFKDLEKTYLSSRHHLLCRSEDHQKLISKVFNRPSDIIYNFNVEVLLECMSSQKKKRVV